MKVFKTEESFGKFKTAFAIEQSFFEIRTPAQVDEDRIIDYAKYAAANIGENLAEIEGMEYIEVYRNIRNSKMQRVDKPIDRELPYYEKVYMFRLAKYRKQDLAMAALKIENTEQKQLISQLYAQIEEYKERLR